MTQQTSILSPPQRMLRHRGIALMLVVVVMGLAAVLCCAMLAGSALQATAASNGVSAAIAQAQAESGIHLAMYYLLNPNNAPAFTGAYWPGTGNSYITFATTQPSETMPGSVCINVAAPVNQEYVVTSIGSYMPPSGTTSITKAITATVRLTFQVLTAGGFNSSVTIGPNMTFNGTPLAISATGNVDLSGGTINGNVAAPKVVGGTFNGQIIPAPSVSPAPMAGTVTLLQNQNPTTISAPGGIITSTTTLGPTPSNPAGVYYYAGGNLTIKGNFTLAGTLVVSNGTLTVESSNVTITAQSGMPALVVSNALQINGASRNFTAKGLVYAGQGVTGVSTNSTDNVTITGALLAASGGITGYSGKMAVTYDPSYTSVPGFTSSNQTPNAIQIVAWPGFNSP